MKKIFIIGHIASGKTTLARQLAKSLHFPVLHVDSYEFKSDASKRDINETRLDLRRDLQQEFWILDGYGPLDMLPENFAAADLVIFLHNSFLKNLRQLVFRQLRILVAPRAEMPLGRREWHPRHVKKLFQTLQKQHRLMEPELLRILKKPSLVGKVLHIRDPEGLRSVYKAKTVFDLKTLVASQISK